MSLMVESRVLSLRLILVEGHGSVLDDTTQWWLELQIKIIRLKSIIIAQNIETLRNSREESRDIVVPDDCFLRQVV